jgi:hypothetical protein
MDRALWITWYDLPETERDAYLAWAHSTYLPSLLGREGFLHAAHFASVPPAAMSQTRQPGSLRHTQDASVPTGCRYIQIVAAEDASAFGDPTPSALNAALPEEMRDMHAQARVDRRMGEAGGPLRIHVARGAQSLLPAP